MMQDLYDVWYTPPEELGGGECLFICDVSLEIANAIIAELKWLGLKAWKD